MSTDNVLHFSLQSGHLPQKRKGDLRVIERKTLAEERRYRLERLAASFRLFAHFGFDEGLAGHITTRDPEHSDLFWVNPFGVHFSQMCVSDLLMVNHDGEVVQGERPVNVAAFSIHSRLHKARPDIVSAAHSHSMYGKSFSTLGKLLDPINQDACAFYEDQALFTEFSGVVEETSEGDAIAAALGDKRAVILQNHGLLTTGPDTDAAVWFFLSMERCCQSQLLAEAAGTPTLIPHEVALKTKAFIANDTAAWGSFQPLYDMILAKDPSFLE